LLPSKDQAALGMIDGRLLIWNWTNNSILFDLPWFYSTPSNIKYLKNNLLAAPASPSLINIWDITSGRVKFSVGGGVYDLELLSNGNLVNTGADKVIRIWSTANAVMTGRISVNASVYTLEQINATTLAGGSSDGYIYAWNLDTLQMTMSWSAHTSAVTSLDLTPSSGLLVSASATDMNIKAWNTAASSITCTGQLTFSWAINCVKIIDNSLIALGLASNYIQFVNVTQTGVLSLAYQVPLPDPSSQALDLSLTAEGYLVVALTDGLVAFLQVNTSNYLLELIPVAYSIASAYIDLIGIYFHN
jgi:hypothetical protein